MIAAMSERRFEVINGGLSLQGDGQPEAVAAPGPVSEEDLARAKAISEHAQTAFRKVQDDFADARRKDISYLAVLYEERLDKLYCLPVSSDAELEKIFSAIHGEAISVDIKAVFRTDRPLSQQLTVDTDTEFNTMEDVFKVLAGPESHTSKSVASPPTAVVERRASGSISLAPNEAERIFEQLDTCLNQARDLNTPYLLVLYDEKARNLSFQAVASEDELREIARKCADNPRQHLIAILDVKKQTEPVISHEARSQFRTQDDVLHYLKSGELKQQTTEKLFTLLINAFERAGKLSPESGEPAAQGPSLPLYSAPIAQIHEMFDIACAENRVRKNLFILMDARGELTAKAFPHPHTPQEINMVGEHERAGRKVIMTLSLEKDFDTQIRGGGFDPETIENLEEFRFRPYDGLREPQQLEQRNTHHPRPPRGSGPKLIISNP
jgi:hypothetical protein